MGRGRAAPKTTPGLVGNLSVDQAALVTKGDVHLWRGRERWWLSRRELDNLNALVRETDRTLGLLTDREAA